MGTFKSLATALALCATMLLAGCGGFSSGGGSNTSSSSQTNTTPDFTVAVTPATASVAKGSSSSLTATVTAIGGFDSAVKMNLYGLPSGVTATFSPSTVTGSGAPTMSLAASTSAANGIYTITLSANSGTITHNTTFSLAVTGTGITPDFSIATNPNQQAVGVGGTENFSVTVIALNDYQETVNLTATGLPSGVTASFSPASITGSGISTLTVSADSTAAAGTYTMTVSGAGSTVNHSVTAGITITTTAPPPDFSLTVAPTTQTVATGLSTEVTVGVAPTNGFTGTVTISESGMPAGMQAVCSPGSITTSGNCVLAISTDDTVVAGTYTITVTGTSGSLTHSGTATVTVTPLALTPDFALSASPSSQTIQAGASTTFTASITPLSGFTDTVTLSASGLPTGVTASFAPATVATSGSSVLTLSSTSSTAAGTYFVTVTGTDGTLVHSANVSLTLTAAQSTADFSLSATTDSQTVKAGASATFTANIASLNSFTGVVTMSASGVPTGVTASFAPATVTGSGSSTLTLTSKSSTAAGTYFLSIIGTDGTLVHSTNVSLTVTPAGTGVSLYVLSAPGASGNSAYNDVPVYLYNNPTVGGATIAVEWGGMDQGPAAGSSQYDFSYPDAQAAPWIAAGKKVNFVVWANADLGATTCGTGGTYGLNNTGNCAIPSYVWTALGSSNQVSCATQYGTQILPNYFAAAFQTNYQAFMAAMIQHYTGNANIGYIRFGLGHGGESFPVANWNDTTSACGQAYVNTWGVTISSWENYLSSMINYEGTLNSPIQLMVGVTPMGNPLSSIPDYAAPIAVQNHMGFGSQGLEESDVNNCPGATADWCNLFNTYAGQVPTELQTLMQSCPLGGCTTGSLSDLIPFAVANHATIFEIYWQDWLVAYDPNYPGYYPAYQPVFQAAVGQ